MVLRFLNIAVDRFSGGGSLCGNAGLCAEGSGGVRSGEKPLPHPACADFGWLRVQSDGQLSPQRKRPGALHRAFLLAVAEIS